MFSVEGCKCNKTGRINVVCEIACSAVPGEMNFTEISFELYMNSTKYIIMGHWKVSVNITEMCYKDKTGRSSCSRCERRRVKTCPR